MAAPGGGGALPPTRPNTSGQVSRTHPQTGRSLARCCASSAARSAQLAKAQSRLECTQVSNRVNFQYYAGSCAACIAASATNPAGQTATRLYRQNTVLYFHYLERKIKFLTSKVDSYAGYFDKAFKLSRRIIKSYKKNLKEMIKIMAKTYTRIYQDMGPALQTLNTRRASYAGELARIMGVLNAKQASYDREIRRQFDHLNSKLAPFAHDLDQQVKLLNSKIASYTSNVDKKMERWRSRYSRYNSFAGRDFRGLDI